MMLAIRVTSKLFNMIFRLKQQGVINISFINDRFAFTRTIFDPNLFMITEKNTVKSWY